MSRFVRRKTNRGFAVIDFTDSYGSECSIQESSLVEPHIWVGVNDANPQIMASQAARHGVETDQQNGWVKYPIPDEVLLSTRMHLTPTQAKKVAKHLMDWAQKNGATP